MSDQSEQKKTGMSKGLRIVFGVSLALNLLVIGALAGAAVRFGGPEGPMRADVGVGRTLYHALPRDSRRALRRDLRELVHRDTLRAARIGPDLDQLLRADVFDTQAAAAVLNRQASAVQQGAAVMQTRWLSIVAEMEPAERSAYADRLKDAKRRKPRPRE